MTPRVAIGVGCRRGIASAPVVALVRETLAISSVCGGHAALFTIDAKRGEEGLSQAAEVLGLPLIFLPREALAAMETPARSERVQALIGLPSVAEAAALAGAGEGAVLIVPRVARDGITCAVAKVAR